jgi:L-ascorbate metabolism protein UlaG (beta-lactamase superfamily)
LPSIKLTYIGGPTLLVEIGGLRLLTDPTFDPAGTDYPTSIYTLHKLKSPAIETDSIGDIDAILLSHDHHFDNLDNAGRQFLETAKTVLTTEAGAGRLGGNARALQRWETVHIDNGSNRVSITGMPARHGPAHADRGPVVGFVLEDDESGKAVYLSGDTVWYEGVVEIGKRFEIGLAVLFMGAACVPEVGPDHLTFTAEEGVEFALAFPQAKIVPVHYEGWAHFVESRAEIDNAFRSAGIADRLTWLEAGVPTDLEV